MLEYCTVGRGPDFLLLEARSKSRTSRPPSGLLRPREGRRLIQTTRFAAGCLPCKHPIYGSNVSAVLRFDADSGEVGRNGGRRCFRRPGDGIGGVRFVSRTVPGGFRQRPSNAKSPCDNGGCKPFNLNARYSRHE